MTDEIEAIRARILETAEIPPPMGRRRVNSKAAKVRALLPEIMAYKKRYPYATDLDVLAWLQGGGLDVKLDTVRKVLQTKKKPHAAARRRSPVISTPAVARGRKQDGPVDESVDGKVRAPRTTRRTSEEPKPPPPSIPPSDQTQDGKSVITEDGQADANAAEKTHLDAFAKRVLPEEL